MQRRLNKKLSDELHSRNTTPETRRTSRPSSISKSPEQARNERLAERAIRKSKEREQEEQRRREEEEREQDLDIHHDHDYEHDHDDETPQVSPQPEYEDVVEENIHPDTNDVETTQLKETRGSLSRVSGSSSGRPRSPATGSRNSQHSRSEFPNNRLGAFLPGSSTSPGLFANSSPRRSTSADKAVKSKSKSNGFKELVQSDRRESSHSRKSKEFIKDDEEQQGHDLLEHDDIDVDTVIVSDGSSRSRSRLPAPEIAEISYDEEDYIQEEQEMTESDRTEDFEPVVPIPRAVTPSGTSRRSRSAKLAPQPPLNKSSSKSSKASKKQSKQDHLSQRDKSPSNSFFGNAQPKAKLSSSSNHILDRKSSSKKYIDVREQPSNVASVNSLINPLGLAGSSGRFQPPPQPQNSYVHPAGSRSRGGLDYGSRAASREALALPIEIPENITDEDAFRRYLSVRRGAYTDIRPLIDFEDDQPSYESVGAGAPSRLPAAMVMNAEYHMGVENRNRTSTLSYAIMTLALLSASASQLRFLVRYSKAHSYPVLNYFLICVCIIIEIIVGVGYVILSRFNFKEGRVDLIQSYLIAGLFFVAIANVIIAAFAFDDHVCEILVKQTILESRTQNQPDIFDSIDQ